jgi:hypothetical protein
VVIPFVADQGFGDCPPWGKASIKKNMKTASLRQMHQADSFAINSYAIKR